jgi:CubicO group peptidase (beta-lactamase class C family)
LIEGRVELDAPVANYLLAFARAGGDKAKITVRHLLTHASGLPAGGAYAGKTRTLTQIVDEIASGRQYLRPARRFLYSDFGFITLAALVEAVTGQPHDAYCRDHIFARLDWPTPLPAQRDPCRSCAATTAGEATPETHGLVHDPTARALGGVAGTRACSARPLTWPASARCCSTRANWAARVCSSRKPLP